MPDLPSAKTEKNVWTKFVILTQKMSGLPHALGPIWLLCVDSDQAYVYIKMCLDREDQASRRPIFAQNGTILASPISRLRIYSKGH